MFITDFKFSPAFASQVESKVVRFDYDLLDDINLKILDKLGEDSSTPFVEIARQIGISDATVHIRV
ncbi:MAG TPA: AsnC family protein, partial [Candidatus Bathyarchaeia archaeon]|nr:AsnC family protein [Candidatus Bathyarchaeia archaeon]